jgi:2-oxoglutarate ferredoxin oxidoreductase subunit alpha
LVIKMAGAAGQGIKTAGLIIAKALKRAGYMTFGYTEYPSLIRGGHNVYQIEIYDEQKSSVSLETDILLALDQASIEKHYLEISETGAVIYDENAIKISDEVRKMLEQKNVAIYPIKLMDEAKNAGGNVLMKNTVALGCLWKVLKLELVQIIPLIEETYNKSQEMIDTNIKCLKTGFDGINIQNDFGLNLTPKDEFKDNIFITGNEAIALGAISAGVRLYVSYPMTPASSILGYLSEEGPKFGMIVKQAEDEITAATMAIGAAHGGTRVMCGTSGGGFDLMTEAVSLSGMTEIPFVCVIAQRPGPATGAPTWTAQGDLNLAVFAGHGEYPRIVIALSDAIDAFYLVGTALNLAEKYQTPVLLLTDKYLAESNFSIPKYDVSKVTIDRGKILKEGDDSKLRYDYTEDGISPRWFPGDKISTFLANSDEHTTKGYSAEETEELENMMQKRMLKEKSILNDLPEPEITRDPKTADLSIISWGSNKQVIKDVVSELEKDGKTFAVLHLTYMWPLKTERLSKFIKDAKKSVVIELNATGQLAHLIKRQTGLDIGEKILKHDGRPFAFDELKLKISNII